MWKFFRKKSEATSLSDEELVALYREKPDQKGPIAVLYDRYAGTLFGFCQKYLKDEEASKDMVADIFLKLFEDLIRFDIRAFKPWLIRVAFNACMGRMTAMGRNVELILSDMEPSSPDEPTGQEDEGPDEQQLLKAIADLKPEQRVCIEMFYLKKRSYQSISSVTGFELKKVKSYIQNGKRNLEIALKSRNGIQ